jgi:predicted metal-dependent HD superfamily phosphohydrolase
MGKLEDRWAALCGRIGQSADGGSRAGELFSELELLYRTPGARAYHGLHHVQACLDELDRVRDDFASRVDVDLAEWSLWLHDCVYIAGAKDNEERSAEVSTRMLRVIGASVSLIESTNRMIIATKHTGETLDEASSLVADVDMSILGASPELYNAYAAAIREEFSFVDEARYRAGRGAFLRGLLARERIYHTDSVFRRLESRSRANIAEEIARLD